MATSGCASDPIGPLLDAMQRLGASVYSERDNRCPPVIADSRNPFRGGATHVDARMSSQFVSAMLMPAPLWPDGLRLQVAGDAARPFVEMTLRIMEAWGVKWNIEGDTITIPGGQAYRARRFVGRARRLERELFRRGGGAVRRHGDAEWT